MASASNTPINSPVNTFDSVDPFASVEPFSLESPLRLSRENRTQAAAATALPSPIRDRSAAGRPVRVSRPVRVRRCLLGEFGDLGSGSTAPSLHALFMRPQSNSDVFIMHAFTSSELPLERKVYDLVTKLKRYVQPSKAKKADEIQRCLGYLSGELNKNEINFLERVYQHLMGESVEIPKDLVAKRFYDSFLGAPSILVGSLLFVHFGIQKAPSFLERISWLEEEYRYLFQDDQAIFDFALKEKNETRALFLLERLMQDTSVEESVKISVLNRIRQYCMFASGAERICPFEKGDFLRNVKEVLSRTPEGAHLAETLLGELLIWNEGHIFEPEVSRGELKGYHVPLSHNAVVNENRSIMMQDPAVLLHPGVMIAPFEVHDYQVGYKVRQKWSTFFQHMDPVTLARGMTHIMEFPLENDLSAGQRVYSGVIQDLKGNSIYIKIYVNGDVINSCFPVPFYDLGCSVPKSRLLRRAMNSYENGSPVKILPSPQKVIMHHLDTHRSPLRILQVKEKQAKLKEALARYIKRINPIAQDEASIYIRLPFSQHFAKKGNILEVFKLVKEQVIDGASERHHLRIPNKFQKTRARDIQVVIRIPLELLSKIVSKKKR